MEARSNLEDRERHAAECDATQLQAFQRTVAKILSDSCVIVDANEKDILQRLDELICAIRDKTVVSLNALSIILLSVSLYHQKHCDYMWAFFWVTVYISM